MRSVPDLDGYEMTAFKMEQSPKGQKMMYVKLLCQQRGCPKLNTPTMEVAQINFLTNRPEFASFSGNRPLVRLQAAWRFSESHCFGTLEIRGS